MRFIKPLFIVCVVLFTALQISVAFQPVYAQESVRQATSSAKEATASANANKNNQDNANSDVTRVENTQKKEFEKLFSKREARHPTITNFVAYSIQYAVRKGVPPNTIVLIMLVPLLATIVLFFRHVVGVPSLAMILPIALSITLLATGLTAGLILLATIILASMISRFILKKIRIVQLSKVTVTMFVVAVAIIATLTLTAEFGVLTVTQISIFPILLLILLSQNLSELQSDRSFIDTLQISAITLSLGILGYFIMSSELIRNFIILYPEVDFLLLPINIIIGRYFGLRITEYIRFAPITQ